MKLVLYGWIDRSVDSIVSQCTRFVRAFIVHLLFL